jgi:Putative auto-transporter adhesin, head GIN domain
MFKKKFLIGIFAVSFFAANSQSDPFTGSEKIVKKKYDFSNFDKISIMDIDGVTEIEVGKPFSIETSIREKYLPIFEVNESNRVLTVVFTYTKNNNKYINDPKIKVKISCPSLDSLWKMGNNSISVSVDNQSKFFMSNEGNGSATLKGLVKQLSLKNDGNGQINAKNLSADTVFVKSFGNGNVIVNSKNKVEFERNGNGQIIRIGRGLLTEVKK